jgi:putative PIN family toxin of toxin-antitoxin system
MGQKTITRVVLDTNTVVSGLLFGGVPGKIPALWKRKLILPLVSKEIFREYLKVLSYPKFKLSEPEISFLIYEEILPYFEVVTTRPAHGIIVSDDSEDDKFIHCAVSGNADYIVSGDSHLLKLGGYGNVKIVNASGFLSSLSGLSLF